MRQSRGVLIRTSTCHLIVMENGAGIRDRTEDILITNQVLYQLSYAGLCSVWKITLSVYQRQTF